MPATQQPYTHPADDPATRQKWRDFWQWLTSDPTEKEERSAQSAADEAENGRDAVTSA